MTKNRLGKLIKKALEDQKLTQTQAAAKLKVTQQQINNWIHGRNNPPVDMLEEIIKLTGKDANYFFGLPSKEFKNNNIVGDNGKNINQTINAYQENSPLEYRIENLETLVAQLYKRDGK